jgi:hypothetical protein
LAFQWFGRGLRSWRARSSSTRGLCGRGYRGGQDLGAGARGRIASLSFVLTVRIVVTDRMLIFGEGHLRRLLTDYPAHYNAQPPHRGVELRLPHPQIGCPAAGPRQGSASAGGPVVMAELAKGRPATSDDGQAGHSWTVSRRRRVGVGGRAVAVTGQAGTTTPLVDRQRRRRLVEHAFSRSPCSHGAEAGSIALRGQLPPPVPPPTSTEESGPARPKPPAWSSGHHEPVRRRSASGEALNPGTRTSPTAWPCNRPP